MGHQRSSETDKLQPDADNGQTHDANGTNSSSDRSSTGNRRRWVGSENVTAAEKADEIDVMTAVSSTRLYTTRVRCLMIGRSVTNVTIIIINIIFIVGRDGRSRREPIRHEKSDAKRMETTTNAE